MNTIITDNWSKSVTPVSAAQQLRDDLRKSHPFPNGTIIRWTSVAVNGARFEYAAIYANGSWYTTIREDNTHLQRQMSHAKLLGYFAQNGHAITGLAVATEFEDVEL